MQKTKTVGLKHLVKFASSVFLYYSKCNKVWNSNAWINDQRPRPNTWDKDHNF